MSIDVASFQKLIGDVEDFAQDWIPDLEKVGDQIRELIVDRTLRGLDVGDGPFKAYSERYQKLIDKWGGKPSGVPNLRGILTDGKGPRRPDRGTLDPDSEMSIDLISSDSDGRRLTLTYNPRKSEYMIWNNDTREWFGFTEGQIADKVLDLLEKSIEDRARRFNA